MPSTQLPPPGGGRGRGGGGRTGVEAKGGDAGSRALPQAWRNHPHPCPSPLQGEGFSSDAGTFFVEAIISAAIVALVLGGTLQAIAASAGRERSVQAHRTALLLAQSELAEVGGDIPLRPGETSGVWNGFVWRVEVDRYDDAGAANAAGALYKAVVTVGARGHGPALVELDSLRLGSEA